MKRTAIIILGAALVLSSCGKSEIPVYDLKDSAVSFKQITNNFSLRGMTEPERELVVEVSLIGPVSDVDRPISYRISGGNAIEGTDFTVVSAMVPAGSIAGSIVLNVKKLPEGTSSRSVSFTIEPNDSFREGFSSFLTANVTWTDSYERPTLYVWRYWHLYLSKGYSRAWNQFLVSIYGDEVELYTCSRTYATDNPSLIYKLPTWWFSTNSELAEIIRTHDLANPGNPYRHSSDYEYFSNYQLPVGGGQGVEEGNLPPTFLETLNTL